MALATWWRGDDMPTLPNITNFYTATTDDASLLARLARLDIENVQIRLCQGHIPYIGWLNDIPVAYGWVATQTAHVGELDLHIALPLRTRYLWDFATLPAWRERGIYPQLLQAILTAEVHDVDHFWIIAAPENRASSAGITKAGFKNVAHLSFQREGQPALLPIADTIRMDSASKLLNLPLLYEDLQKEVSPCWHCAIESQQKTQQLIDVDCWSLTSPIDLTMTACTCGCATVTA